jgi:hypothetical protein
MVFLPYIKSNTMSNIFITGIYSFQRIMFLLGYCWVYKDLPAVKGQQLWDSASGEAVLVGLSTGRPVPDNDKTRKQSRQNVVRRRITYLSGPVIHDQL